MATAMFGEHTTLSAAAAAHRGKAKKEGEIGVGNWDAPRIMERMRAREREKGEERMGGMNNLLDRPPTAI